MNDLHDTLEEIRGKAEKISKDINQKGGKGSKGLKGGMKKVKERVRRKTTQLRDRAMRAGAKGDINWDRDEY